MVHILAKSFRHSPVALIGVHDSREYTVHRPPPPRRLCRHRHKTVWQFIAAVIVEVSGVHINTSSPYFTASASASEITLFLFHLGKHFFVTGCRLFEMNVQRRTIRHDVLIAVTVFSRSLCSCTLPDHRFLYPGYGQRCGQFHHFLPWGMLLSEDL